MKAEEIVQKIYDYVDATPGLNKLVKKGGIKFKFALIISSIILLIVFIFSMIFTIMSSNSLISANDKLCRTIAGNISSAESIITAERKPFKRSLILQDMISALKKSKISGLEYAAIYDLKGKLVERNRAYAAHTNQLKRGKRFPKEILKEIELVKDFEKKSIVLTKEKEKIEVPCFQYRMPFEIFKTKVGVIEIVFTEDSILGPVRTARMYVLLSGFLLLITGAGISIVTATNMVKPIKDLSDGMNKVRDGDLEVNMNIKRHDELGDLSNEFNTMISHLREKLQMQKFVSDSTISMIKEQTSSGDIGLGGKRENFVFLFSDIRGFTAMSEKMEPEDVVSILNEYLDLQAHIIKNNKGDIDKFVGY